MTYQLAPFADIPLDEKLLEALIAEHESITIPRLVRLWTYYRNALAEPLAGGGAGRRARRRRQRVCRLGFSKAKASRAPAWPANLKASASSANS